MKKIVVTLLFCVSTCVLWAITPGMYSDDTNCEDDTIHEYITTSTIPFAWKNFGYYKPGFYEDTRRFISTSGCDSVHIGHITIVASDSTNTIFYTTTDDHVVSPYKVPPADANIIENSYQNGQGKMVFDSPISMIVNQAFMGCDNLKEVVIPRNVINVGDWTFQKCTNLTSITIPNNVTHIGVGPLSGCSGLTSLIVEAENAVYDSRESCNAIIKSADNTLVAGCKNTLIPNSVTRIGDNAFRNNSSLASIAIPNSVISIGDNVFYQCYDLSSVTLPNSVVSIGNRTFSHCVALISITIPNSVTSIGEYALEGCSALTSITCKASIPPVLGSNVFLGVPRDIPLYVPAASIPAYQAADQWDEFDLFPLYVEVNTVCPNTTELTWNPVDSASLYQLHIYTDSTSSVALDTTLLINADSLNGGIMVQPGTSVARQVKKIIHGAGGTIIVITIDPTSGTSEENPYKVTVSTASGERIDVHYDMTVFQGTTILREESGIFVLNENIHEAIENVYIPSLPTGIYDLYGHHYPATAWESLPAGVYVLKEEDRVEKVMKK